MNFTELAALLSRGLHDRHNPTRRSRVPRNRAFSLGARALSDERLTQLEIENARLAVSLEHLSEAVKELTGTVQQLRDTMNRGRGALWVVVGASTLVGGAISAALTKWLSH